MSKTETQEAANTMANSDGGNRILGFKDIASYISKAIGREFSENAARMAVRRSVCPLPVIEFNGRYEASARDLDEWIAFMRNRRTRGGARGAKLAAA